MKVISFDEPVELAVVGESFENPDHTSRQRIIARLQKGEPVQLVRERHNQYDSNAIRVDSRLGCIGMIGRGDAADLARVMDAGIHFKAEIANIAGGTPSKPARGVWLTVSRA